MFSVLTVVLPIFALIFAGWICRRGNILGPLAATEINRFVVYLALPALLFDIVASAQWSDIWQPAFIATFGLGVGVVFVVTLVLRLARARHLADAAIDGLNAAYANTAFLGFPLVLAVIGPEAMAPAMIATILTVCVLFSIALILVEIGLQSEARPSHMVKKLAMSMVRNPLIVAPVLGALFLSLDLKVPSPVESFLKLLGAAASPCALVGLGLFLGERRQTTTRVAGSTALLAPLKLVGQPAVTWILATHVFQLSMPLTHVATLLAALPTGTGPFMVAEFYRREGVVTSRTILFSTMASLGTITAYLTWSA
ncbi:AEC family transporter [Bordetella genomosp. 4]|uniref:Transporter n=1 Tax=Bordetella genomosp. 4 TaxID=463044 RepID=A0A261V0Q7_9BORD|nr:AEC family transporter [Bordetella genomosp. 4]OZI67505.1 transporter [Bordetella genomosp. 4]